MAKKTTILLQLTLVIMCFVFFVASARSQQFDGFSTIRLGANQSDFIKTTTAQLKEDVMVVSALGASKEYWESQDSIIRGKIPPSHLFLLRYRKKDAWPTETFSSRTGPSSSAYILNDTDTSIHVYYLSSYRVDTFALANLYLVFKAGKLGSIELSYAPEFVKAASEKYPPTFKRDTSYMQNCISASGEELKFRSYQKNYTWNYPDAVVEASAGIVYGSSCYSTMNNFIRFRSKEILDYLELLRRKN